MKKFLLSFFTPLLVSLFFFIPQVKAEEYNATLSNSNQLYSSSFLNARLKALDYISQNGGYYIISLKQQNVYYIYFFTTFTFDSYKRSNDIKFSINSNFIRYIYYANNDTFSFDSNQSSFTYYIPISGNVSWPLIDSNYDFIFQSASGSVFRYSLTYNNEDYIFTIQYGQPFFTEYYIYQTINSTSDPVPEDNTPLLTSFVDIVIEKLTLVCNFFTSSYIYLSIFVIFIFYFVIYLLRRFK